MLDSSDKEIIEKLHLETAKISWLELQRFFASGKVLMVDANEDILEVAAALVKDDSEKVSVWLEKSIVQAPSNEQAQAWFDNETVLWAVVVSPWVLVQDLSN